MLMPSYDTLTEAITALRQRGYGLDYNLTDAGAECVQVTETLLPEQLKVEETYRFEGDSNPDDNMVLYALQSRLNAANKGLLVAAFGPYVETQAADFIQRLDGQAATPS